LRFAVHRPGNPEASPRSHGVPSRDVPSRVHVSVADKTAGGASEDGLTLARLPIYVPTRRAPLTRERRVDLFHPAGSLVLQSTHQQSPPGLQDLPVEPGLGSHVPARVASRTLSRAGQITDAQVLDHDQVEPSRDVRADLLCPVLAPIGLTRAQPGAGQSYPPAACRVSLSAGELALQAQEAVALPKGKAGAAQQLTCRQGCGHRHAPVNPDHPTAARCRDWLRNGRESYMPATGPVQGYAVGLHARRHRPRPAEPYPTGLRYPHLADVVGQATHVPLLPTPPHDPKTLVPAGLPPRWPPGGVLRVKERGHRLGKIPQRLLLYHLGARGQPRVIGPRLGELSALLQVARRALAARVPLLVLLDGEVPHIPCVRAMGSQHHLLGGCEEQPVPGHTNILAITTDISGEVKRRLSLA
jgi:hypothetical protein